uniref:5'-nucleotidase, cytosolic IIIB n=1 Tax=Zonotrichia albicollis TaxID=44394 RepID=A0A8D2MCT4_ZONAL
GAEFSRVISDFDMTLSRFGCNGRRCPTSHNILDTSRVISEDGKKKLKDLLHHYYPIEIDPNRTLEEKRPLMVEWWTKAHELLVQQKIHKSDIAEIVRESEAMLRYRLGVVVLSFGHGLLSWQVEERRKKYLDSYDIVLESDETLDVVNGILRYLLGLELHLQSLVGGEGA